MFLPFEIEKVVDRNSCITNHPFDKLKVVVQNTWLLNEGLLTGTGIVTIVSL